MRNRGCVLQLLLGVLLLCCGGTAVALLVVRIFFGGVLQEPTTVEVMVDAPDQVVLNEPFTVTLQLTNIFTTDQTLHSLDFEEGYLENVRLTGSQPAFQAEKPLPLSNFASYSYDLVLPVDIINRPTTIELTFVGVAVGEFSGLMDVCLDDGTFCVAVPLATAVVEK